MNFARAQLKTVPGLADRMGSLMGVTSMIPQILTFHHCRILCGVINLISYINNFNYNFFTLEDEESSQSSQEQLIEAILEKMWRSVLLNFMAANYLCFLVSLKCLLIVRVTLCTQISGH